MFSKGECYFLVWLFEIVVYTGCLLEIEGWEIIWQLKPEIFSSYPGSEVHIS